MGQATLISLLSTAMWERERSLFLTPHSKPRIKWLYPAQFEVATHTPVPDLWKRSPDQERPRSPQTLLIQEVGTSEQRSLGQADKPRAQCRTPFSPCPSPPYSRLVPETALKGASISLTSGTHRI